MELIIPVTLLSVYVLLDDIAYGIDVEVNASMDLPITLISLLVPAILVFDMKTTKLTILLPLESGVK